jgi:hypothetical protein
MYSYPYLSLKAISAKLQENEGGRSSSPFTKTPQLRRSSSVLEKTISAKLQEKGGGRSRMVLPAGIEPTFYP